MCHPQASLLASLGRCLSVVFSILLYGEQMTALRLVVGFVLIFAAVINETLPLKEKPCRKNNIV